MTVGTALCSLLLFAAIPGGFSAGFGGIPGDYCKIRSPVKCCVNRDDDCTMPILGNHLCYCDMFCRRPDADNGDCCPDFKFVCEGIKPQRRGECRYQGVLYYSGDTVQQNCNECTCEADPSRPDEHFWNCPNRQPCLIEEDSMQKINSGRYSWTARNYSRFWGKALDFGMKFRLGTLYPDKSVENMNEILIKPVDLPDRFDAREKWPNYIHDVRDQENCGSSWAYSTTATSADRLAIMSEGKLNAQLSTQQLLSCNQHRQHGCEGGYLDRAWWYIRKLGVVSDECYPYSSGRSNEPGSCQIPKSQYRRAEGVACPSPSGDNKIFKMTPPYRVSSKEADIMTEIMINGPVQATFLVHEDFFMYSGGVYKYADIAEGQQFKREGYHSVRILGWGEDRSTGRPAKYWLAANSWGPQWGEEGFFRIQRGENHCQVEAFIIGAWGKGSKKRRRRFKIRRLKLKRLRKLRRL